jgi:hypothetical protein
MARGRDAMDRTGLEREGRLGRTAKYSFHGDERNNIEMESGFYFMGPRGDKKKGGNLSPYAASTTVNTLILVSYN